MRGIGGHFASLMLGAAMVIACAGCDRDDMHNNARIRPFESAESTFRPVPGTVARHQVKDDHLQTGRVDGGLTNVYPFPITREVLTSGREQYTIFCAVCHGATGDGEGMIVKRGFTRPPSFHETRLRNAPAGHYFDVITNGRGAMYSYSDRITPEKRWEIAAYVRVLQLSQNAPVASLPAEVRQDVEKATEP